MTYQEALVVLKTLYSHKEIAALVGTHENTVSFWVEEKTTPRDYHQSTLIRLGKKTENTFSFAKTETWKKNLEKIINEIDAPRNFNENQKLEFRCKVYDRRCKLHGPGNTSLSLAWLRGHIDPPTALVDALSIVEEI